MEPHGNHKFFPIVKFAAQCAVCSLRDVLAHDGGEPLLSSGLETVVGQEWNSERRTGARKWCAWAIARRALLRPGSSRLAAKR